MESKEEILYKFWKKWVNKTFQDADSSIESFNENFEHSFVLEAMDEYKRQPTENKVNKALVKETEELLRLKYKIMEAPEVSDLFRSFYAICERNGVDTNWEAITKRIKIVLELLHINGITPRTFRLYPDYPITKEKAAERGWVSVENELPEPGQYFLLYNGNWIGVGKYSPKNDYDENTDYPIWESETSEYITPNPTHWMPLPPKPGESQSTKKPTTASFHEQDDMIYCSHCQQPINKNSNNMNPKDDNINPETGKEYFSNLNPEKLTKHLPKEESIQEWIEKEIKSYDVLFNISNASYTANEVIQHCKNACKAGMNGMHTKLQSEVEEAVRKKLSIEGSDIEKQLQLKEKRIKELQDEIELHKKHNVIIKSELDNIRQCEKQIIEQVLYWKSRCEAAEELLDCVDININKKFVGYKGWQELKNKQP